MTKLNKNWFNLLLIEDDESIITFITEITKKNNVNLSIGYNKKDFLEKISKIKFDLILCDINLSYNGEGFDIIKIYKEQNLKIPIHAFTSLEELTSEHFISKGFASVIYKNEISRIQSFLTNKIKNQHETNNTLC